MISWMNTDQFLQDMFAFLRQFGLAILIFVASLIVARIVRSVVHRFAGKRNFPPDITTLLLQLSETVFLIFGGITALGTIGIDIGALIAGLGLVGFALGFALRDLLSNLIAGLMIVLYDPFMRGDVISVTGNEGTVVEINMRYTVLNGAGKRILIPNQSIFSNVVIVTRKNT